MEQLEKVRKGLECCIASNGSCCPKECPYNATCFAGRTTQYVYVHLMEDALSMIRQQQDRIKALEAAQKWISVKDRLPDADGDYLVFGQSWYGGQSMAVSIANYVRDISDTGFSDQHRPAWVSIFDWDEFDITHWMPLPEPPKEEEHESKIV